MKICNLTSSLFPGCKELINQCVDALASAQVGVSQTYNPMDPVRIHLNAAITSLNEAYAHILDMEELGKHEKVIERERFWMFTPDGEMEEVAKEVYAMEEAHDVYELN